VFAGTTEEVAARMTVFDKDFSLVRLTTLQQVGDGLGDGILSPTSVAAEE